MFKPIPIARMIKNNHILMIYSRRTYIYIDTHQQGFSSLQILLPVCFFKGPRAPSGPRMNSVLESEKHNVTMRHLTLKA